MCAARLDQPLPPAAAGQLTGADLDILHTASNRLLDLLQPDGPTALLSAGGRATPAQYFADLRLASGLISAAWPASRPLFPAPALADAFSEHVADSTRHGNYRIYDTPPLDTLACAALVTAAVGILDSPDLRLLGEHLAPARDPGGTSRDSPRWRWIRRYRRTRHECSGGFQDALEPLLPTFRCAGQHRHGHRAPARDTGFGPEHIPEHLQDDWFGSHFRHIDGIGPRLLRRAAAVRLVQMTAGGSLTDAAAYLGIDHRYIAASPGTAFAAAAYWTPGTGPAEFHLAVHALARQLSATSDLINYRHRRDALQDWCIDPVTWQDIISRLPPDKRAVPARAQRLQAPVRLRGRLGAHHPGRARPADRSGSGVPELRAADKDAEGGRGLGLVAGLAARWGWRRHGARTVTWFELQALLQPMQHPAVSGKGLN